MFQVISIGASLRLAHHEVHFVHLPDAVSLFSAQLVLTCLDGFILQGQHSPEFVKRLRTAYPQTLILVANIVPQAELSIAYLRAGANDILYGECALADICARLLTHLKYRHFQDNEPMPPARIPAQNTRPLNKLLLLT